MCRKCFSMLLVLCLTLTLLPVSAAAAETAHEAVYLGVQGYGSVTAADVKDEDRQIFRFWVDGQEVEYKIKKVSAHYDIQNVLQEGYIFDLTVEDDTVTSAVMKDRGCASIVMGAVDSIGEDSLVVAGTPLTLTEETGYYKITNALGGSTVERIDLSSLEAGGTVKVSVSGSSAVNVYQTFVAEDFTPVVSGEPGVRTLKNLLATAMEPLGTALYLYGGTWTWENTSKYASRQATTIGVPRSWIDFFQENNGTDYNCTAYRTYDWHNYYYIGTDCSGFIGWTIYNVMETESRTDGTGGYVGKSTGTASRLAGYGWGTCTNEAVTSSAQLHPGDIVSQDGHVWMVVGVCTDGSVVFIHSSASKNVNNAYGGGGVQLSALPNPEAEPGDSSGSKECEAYQLVKEYTERYYPAWSENFPVFLRDFDYYTKLDKSGAGDTYADRFIWTLDGSGISDPDGYAVMTANDILADLFDEAVPGAPAVSITDVTAGDGTLTVSWSLDGGGITDCSIRVTPASGGATTVVPAGPEAMSQTVTGLTNGTAYSVVVTAKNPSGTAASDPVDAAPKAETQSGSGSEDSGSGSEDSGSGFGSGSGSGSSSGSGGVGGSAGVAAAVTAPLAGNMGKADVEVSVSGATVTVEGLTAKALANIAGEAKGAGPLTMDFSDLRKNVTGAVLPACLFEAAAGENPGADGLCIRFSAGSVAFDAEAASVIAAQADGGKVTLRAAEVGSSVLSAAQRKNLDVASVFNVSLTCNGKSLPDLGGGSAVVSLPFSLPEGKSQRGYSVLCFAESAPYLVGAVYSAEQGSFVFTASRLSDFAVIYSEYNYQTCAKDQSCPADAFVDVTTGAWYHDGVHYAIENGLMAGYDSEHFGPEDGITRAQFVEILWEMDGAPSMRGAMHFTDVRIDDWYADAVLWAEANGIASGYTQELFVPNALITREQLAVMLHCYAQYKGTDAGEINSLTSFDDWDLVSDYARTAMGWAVSLDLIPGADSGALAPWASPTRAEVAAILMRYCTQGTAAAG